MDTSLPSAFDASNEPNKALAKVKASIAKKFSWTKRQPLYDALKLAVLLVVHRKDQEAVDVCRALGRIGFNGSFDLWCAVQNALTLQARLCRQQGALAEAEECLRRVREAGFVETRLEGRMLDPNGALAESLKDGDKKWEQAARLSLASELAFIIELGGSAALPVDAAEKQWKENLAELRKLVGLP